MFMKLELIYLIFKVNYFTLHCRAVASGGLGGLKPISTRGDTLSPPSTTSPPGLSDLATALHIKEKKISWEPFRIGLLNSTANPAQFG